MHQGQDVGGRAPTRTERGRAVLAVLAVTTVAVVTVFGAAAPGPDGAAMAAPTGRPPTSPAAPTIPTPLPPPTTTSTTSTTTVVSPTTTVTTTTAPGRTTTSTTTVSTSGGATTSTTTVTPTDRPPGTPPVTVPAPRGGPTTTTTTTTTTVPAPTTTASSAPTSNAAAPTVGPLPGPPTFDTGCSRPATPALQTYLDSLPSGSTFRSSTTACYLVPYGIRLTHPITLIGGTFFDPNTDPAPAPFGPHYEGLKAIILIKNTSHVTLSGVTVLGVHVQGYHAKLVGQAGVRVMSSRDVTLVDVLARNTYGDGLELVADLTEHILTPVTGLRVEGFTTINAGRQGVTLAEVASSVLDDVHVVSPADTGIDFESDVPGLGSGNITISNCTDDKGFNIAEFLYGTVTIAGCTEFHHVTLRSPHSNAPVTFVGGTLGCRRIDPLPCIDQSAGSLTFRGVQIVRMPGTLHVHELAWYVDSGGSLTFDHSLPEVPIGTVVSPSTVQWVN